MRKLCVILLLFSVLLNAQTKKEQIVSIKSFQKDLNEEYLNPKATPLRGDNLKNFKEHPSFRSILNIELKLIL